MLDKRKNRCYCAKMKQQNEKQRMNKPSTLLSQDENDLVFSLLGRRCQVWKSILLFVTKNNEKETKLKLSVSFFC